MSKLDDLRQLGEARRRLRNAGLAALFAVVFGTAGSAARAFVRVPGRA